LDNLTHSLFGLTLGRTALGRAGRGTTAALLLASNAPDIDIVTTAGGALNYLEWHRGPTHGPIGVVGLGLVTAALVWIGRRWWDRPSTGPSASFLQLWMIAIAGVICHILMDLPTSYGTRVLSPFDWHWFAEDWMPIIDVYLLIVLGAGLFFGRQSASARQRNAAIALGFMIVNYGVRAGLHHQALVKAPGLFGASLPERCDDAVDQGWIDRWPRPAAGPGGADDRAERARAAQGSRSGSRGCLVEIAAMPDFVSPFHWRVIAQLSNAYETQSLNLLARPQQSQAEWRLSVRHPNQWTPAVYAAAGSRTATVFLGFSRFPAARSVIDRNGEAVVRWSDMRFAMGGSGDARPQRPNLFTAMVRLDPEGRVVEEKFGP
jgi:inner membrane protein